MKLVRSYDHVRQKNRFVKEGGMSYVYNFAPHDPEIEREVEQAASDYEKARYEKHRRIIQRTFYC